VDAERSSMFLADLEATISSSTGLVAVILALPVQSHLDSGQRL